MSVLVPVLLVLGLSFPVLADEREISVGGVWICRLTQDAAGYTSYQRAVEVRKRITEILSTPSDRTGVVVKVQQSGNDAVILAGDRLVFTVTPEDTLGPLVAPHTTPLDLARLWAGLLSKGLNRAFPDPTLHVF